jgi:hypothetical protein
VKTRFADTPPGHLPFGFVALDLAHELKLTLLDPDDGYRTIADGQHTRLGKGLIGGDRKAPKIIVAANGGSDLIYLPDGDKALAKRVVDVLLAEDYVSGIFVDSKLGKFPGTAALDDIALEGSAAAAGDRNQLPLVRYDLRRTGALHGRDRRYRPAARPGHARFVQPRRYLEFHGDAGAGLQIAVHRSGAGQQRRPWPHDRAADAALAARQGQTRRTGAFGDAAERCGAGLYQPRRQVGSSRQRPGDGHRHADVGTTRYFDAAGFPSRTVGLSSMGPASATQ